MEKKTNTQTDSPFVLDSDQFVLYGCLTFDCFFCFGCLNYTLATLTTQHLDCLTLISAPLAA